MTIPSPDNSYIVTYCFTTIGSGEHCIPYYLYGEVEKVKEQARGLFVATYPDLAGCPFRMLLQKMNEMPRRDPS